MVLESASRKDDLVRKIRVLLLAELKGQNAINFERELMVLYNKYKDNIRKESNGIQVIMAQ